MKQGFLKPIVDQNHMLVFVKTQVKFSLNVVDRLFETTLSETTIPKPILPKPNLP